MTSAAASSSNTGDVGISPVLLQAITHTLSNKPRAPEHVIIHTAAGDHIKVETPLLQSSSHPQSGSVVYVQEATDEQVETVETTEIWADHSMDSSSGGGGTVTGGEDSQQSGEVNMGNVLSALASHFKNNGHVKQEKESPTKVDRKHVPSVTHEVIVAESSCGAMSLIKRPRIELADNTNTSTPLLLTKIDDNTYVDSSTGASIPIHIEGGTVSLDGSTSFVLRTPSGDTVQQCNQEEFKPCPICGDKISGGFISTRIM